ncbi:4335_t:CDS:2 [Dentiscutata heterogama]|uniref:4335_t:CDS:1 n=1 Tax=Dentiscutata heterogama TaxID=1316150 RepID=A0ACA9L497_9GLOM|nr:4335_t:CDS:2 [Dentiscutata heterogama]
MSRQTDGKENALANYSQRVRTPVNALRDITNKTPQIKTVRHNKDGYNGTPAVSFTKQQKNSKSSLDRRFKIENDITKQQNLKGPIEDLIMKPSEEEADVPEIEYCPPPIKELSYEPLDEDLKFDWEPLRHLPSVTAYEFENIKYDELSFPKIDPNDYRSREVMDDYGK